MTKKKRNKIGILLAVLCLVCALIFGLHFIQDKQEDIQTSEDQILSIQADDVESLSWTYNDNTLSFHKEDTWIYDEDENFPVNTDQINTLLKVFESLQSTFKIENVEDYDQYGLKNPTCTITIGTKDKTYTISLGDFSKMDSQRYVSIDDGNVYLVETDPLDTYDLTLKDMIQNDDTSIISEDVTTISFKGEEEYKIEYQEDNDSSYCSDDVYFTDGKPLDTDNVEAYIKVITGLDLTNYVTYNATEEELETYGLNSPIQTVKVKYTEDDKSQSITIHVSKVDDASYLQVNDSKIIYEITSDEYDDLTACSYNDLRHKEVVVSSFDDITKIDFTLDGKPYTCEHSNDVWKYKDEEIDFSDIQSAMEALKAKKFVSKNDSNTEEIEFTLYLKNDKEYNVKIYQKDGKYCITEINGEITSKVSREKVIDLVEAVNAIVLN